MNKLLYNLGPLSLFLFDKKKNPAFACITDIFCKHNGGLLIVTYLILIGMLMCLCKYS